MPSSSSKRKAQAVKQEASVNREPSSGDAVVRSSGSDAASDTVRIQRLEGEVTKLLSIITLQTEQLARQERAVNQIRDINTSKERGRMTFCWFLLAAAVAALLAAIHFNLPVMMSNITEDTVLRLNVLATPTKLPFVTAGVKVRFTMGDLLFCIKRSFQGDTLELSMN
ncbi:hypothetical protein THAOC_19072 [Thalassiosira oceanica]|uniref:Uncharacterized protein n=1 Tax=Thalassiosira oceanica TaxID=159749 RepID=K0S5J8_THAOC|nr:hypothetical protein THAOC_19072 [Thalassiosira oceanica]|mmetsp:Transcript_12944/g.30602  ORF Transcript_12944/g.30602 Transcript_12944/m.30602 type:complete len:168 (+) Transcript_12944:245-748(+)|eukprot:EJK60550.1 hypothetical protein THAOC_19072 [Thalassiosira oceanica]